MVQNFITVLGEQSDYNFADEEIFSSTAISPKETGKEGNETDHELLIIRDACDTNCENNSTFKPSANRCRHNSTPIDGNRTTRLPQIFFCIKRYA
ncbi:hypothetical protein RvY_14700 [Ramazzottius varieornatus]|uniref:Uncharacterized protein n=1 Tax=Ramazzottius varieornatus TaxID=947166 RepID=A0A1D1VTU9_RAMVA|nr:hypothetical protein RvY_14700 [Ramazzottius varieornatus]